jgi:hypothetical protein
VQLVAEIPAVSQNSDRILELSFGMRFGQVRDFLLAKAQAIIESPYECEHFQEMNEQAAEAHAQLSQPMPPFVNNFRGLRVSLTDLVMTDTVPENARGLLAVHVHQPQMFVGMAQMFLPDLSGLELEAGKPPIRLPESLIPYPGIVAFAAMSSDAIGLSLGDGEEAGLETYLNEDPGPAGTFLSMSYDAAAYIEYTDQVGKQSHEDMTTDEDHDEYEDEHENLKEGIEESMQNALKSMADRSHTTFRFTTEGMVIDGRITFR